MNVLNAEDYGAYSVRWMIKMAAVQAPRDNLEYAFQCAVEYVDALALEKPVIGPDDFLDALGQLILTGEYVPTAFPRRANDEDDDDDESVTEGEITEAEIAQFIAEIEDLPTAKEVTYD